MRTDEFTGSCIHSPVWRCPGQYSIGENSGEILNFCYSGMCMGKQTARACPVDPESSTSVVRFPIALPSFYSEPQPLPSWLHIPTAFQVMDERMLAAAGRTDPWGSGVRGRQPPPPQPPAAAAPANAPSPSWTSAPCPSPSSPLALSSDPESMDPNKPLPIGWGYHWDSVVCEGARYLPFLTAQVCT